MIERGGAGGVTTGNRSSVTARSAKTVESEPPEAVVFPSLPKNGHRDIVSKRGPSTQVDYRESTISQGKSGGSDQTDHLLTKAAGNDPALMEVAQAWPKLPEAIRAGILAMIRAGK